MQFSALGDTLLLGDFNPRTGLLLDVPDEDDIPAQSSKDTSVNSYGQYLLDLCIGLNLRIINGRSGNDNCRRSKRSRLCTGFPYAFSFSQGFCCWWF